VRHEDRLWRPATTAVPGQHLHPGRGENASPIEKGFDLVLVYVDVLGSQPVEQLSAVHAIELVQHVAHQVTHVEDRPVDVEHHEKVILWVSDAAVDIVPGQAAHPVRHPSEPFVPGRLAVAVVPLSIAGDIAQLHASWRNHARSVNARCVRAIAEMTHQWRRGDAVDQAECVESPVADRSEHEDT
jgi:hypothetical protein